MSLCAKHLACARLAPSEPSPWRLHRRRCLVLLDGFYEWKKGRSGKQPYYVQLSSGEPMVGELQHCTCRHGCFYCQTGWPCSPEPNIS